MRISEVQAPRCLGGEGPLWDASEQALYYLDNFGRKIHRYEPATGAARMWETPATITAFALREQGGAVLTLTTGVHFLDLKAGAFEQAFLGAEPKSFVFNDGKVDRRGRFVLGGSTANQETPTPDGGLYSLGSDRRLAQLDSGVHFSNGPCWSPDNKTLYFADSFLSTSFAYDYDIETGQVANKRRFANTSELGGMPDGATVDSDGLVWIAIYQGGKIAAFRPDGRLERVIELPPALTTSVMFGGPNLDQLYVTTMNRGDPTTPAADGSGALYVIEDLGARGLPEPRFAG